MAGGRDTPEQRRRRDEAMTPSEEDEALTAATEDEHSEPAARRAPGGGRPNALVASAMRVRVDDRKMLAGLRRRRQAWQSEAWDYFDEVPEVGFTVTYLGNLISKVRLFAATRPDPASAPVPVDDPESGIDPKTAQIAIDTLERLQSPQGGQSALIREMSINFEVCGECYLHGHEDAETGDEDWQIRSVDELVPDGEWFGLRTGLGSRTLEPVPTDDVIIRLWERHPRFSMLASCSMRRVLADCESLLLLSREIRATAKSRLSNGFLLKPSELSFGAINPTQDPSDGEGTNDPFDDDLNETMITAVQEEGSAAAIVPITITGPAEYLKEFRHVPLSRPIDASLDKRIEGLVMRIARGLNAPVEVTTGLAETTFANAAQVKQDEFDAHIEPRCTMECDALTAGYFQPALEEAAVDHDLARQIFIWFDPAAAVASPDPADNAEKAHEDGVISDEARRRYQGYAESDAPTDDELLRRILLHATRLDPNVLAQLLIITGLAPGIVVPPAAGATAIAPGEQSTTAVVASARLSDPRSLGRRLMEIDRDLRTRTQVAAESALRRALERAGNRIRTSVQRDRSGETSALRRVADSTPSHLVASALGRQMVAAAGLTDGDLLDGQFDDVADEFASRATSARRRALAAVAAVYGPLDPATAAEIDTQGDAATATARDWLVGALAALAATRLYAAETTSTAKGETAGGVPVGVARAAVAIAGGAQVAVSAGPGEMNAVRTVGGAPVGGVATGPLVLDAAGAVEAWEWDYGTADRAPFEPHLDVDGLVFTSWDDPELMNVDGWPDAFVAPGDHDGCFPAGTVVSGPPVRGATLRYHKGEVVTVGFASGKLLTATPNHPVLTDRGWVAAGLLDEGDRVVRCADGQRVAGLVPDDEQVPSRIEDVAAAFDVRPGVVARRVEVTPMNFHGDGVGSKVAVVWTDGDLGDRGVSAASEVGGEATFPGAHPVLGLGLAGDSGGTTLLERVGDAPLGVVGGAGPLDPLLGRDGGGVQSAALSNPAVGLARVEENLLDVPAGHAEADGDVVLRLATPIGVDDGVGWRFGNEASGGGLLTGERVRLGAATEHTTLGEYLPQERRGDAESAGGGFGSLPFEVRLDSVVHVEKRRFEGHVYNLQTEGHWYVADGVVVHNCACDVIPILVAPGGDATVDTGDGA